MWSCCCGVFIVCGAVLVSGALNFIPPQKVDKNLIVTTNKGTIQGRTGTTYTGKKYWAYEGIPFAKPPVGELRFRAPEHPDQWTGTLDCTKERNTCVEMVNTPDITDLIISGHEDCLYLNVYAPENPNTPTKLSPVMVWIYGGGFIFGNSSSSFYGADNYLNQGIVIVTFNYRIGVFGFLSTEDLESPGNYGLKDQHLALRWVKNNIKQFGGDRNKITISGQSAGSASVFYQILHRNSKDLFHSAIANSGSPLCNWALQRNPRKIAFDIGVGLGLTTSSSKELMRQLRKLPVERVEKATRLVSLIYFPQSDREGFPFSPTIEPPHKGAFITKTPYEMFQKGEFNRVPILTGINSLETLFFTQALELIRPLNFLYDLSPGSLPNKDMNIRTNAEKTEVGKRILRYYFPDGSYINANIQQILQFTSDDRFNRPIHKTVQLISRYTTVYYYLFSYSSEYGKESLRDLITDSRPAKGVAHLEEQFYLWRRNNLDPKGMDKLTSKRLLKIWDNFLRNRNPTPTQEPILQNIIWPPVRSPDNVTYLQIDKDLFVRWNYREKQMEFWEKLYEKYGRPPYLTY